MSAPREVELGAIRQGEEVRFSLRSHHASAAEVCLYAPGDLERELGRLALESDGDGTWSGVAEGVELGTGYGFRLAGPTGAGGHRFDSSKLLIDPYARAIAGDVRWSEALLGSSAEDSSPYVPRCLVPDRRFDWGDDAPPRTSWAGTVIYECHVRGMTRLHPQVPPELRGTFLGLSEEPIVEHLRRLGVTALELMPVQHFVSERHLAERGLSNYWGYSPISFFAPHSAYATGIQGEQVTEFKTMVRRLHRAGIEVILDLVVNHTAEGGADGPTLSLRGVDNASYYKLSADDPSRYVDFTGCGNTLDFDAPEVRRLVLDCLHFWVEEMHVDGFRFDLAATLGRGGAEFSTRAPLFEAIAASPILSRVKLIAEPWDLGPNGYQVGEFPDRWREWNDRYRDSVRRFWRGDGGQIAELATRLSGSSDLYERRRGGALVSINYVACHDGFTLEDLVSHDRKDNSANLEGNRDGRDHNLSSNWGVEGPTRDPEVLAARQRAKKNLLATLALSAGVPMLSHGDEMGRTQLGNNNAYCQDNIVTWVDWNLDARGEDLLEFTRGVLRLRRRLGFLRRQGFFSPSELRWLGTDGRPLADADWSSSEERELGMLIERPAENPCGSALLLLNAGVGPVDFHLPEIACNHSWVRLLATVEAEPPGPLDTSVEVPGYSLAVLACGAAGAERDSKRSTR